MKKNEIVTNNQDKHINSKENLDARKNKYYLMKEGLPFIKEELQENWLEYVDEFSHDKTDLVVIEISILCLKKLKNNTSFEVINKTFTELNIDETTISNVLSIITIFSIKAEEFKEYWNTTHPSKKIQNNYAYYKYI